MDFVPEISIIMPTYNVEKYIAEAIKSVIQQSFQNWELIIVNDGSQDNSEEIAKEFAKKDSRIRIVRKENGGLSDARNFGIKIAKGKYLHLFDPDDFLMGEFYTPLYECAETYRADIVISGYKLKYIDHKDNIKLISANIPILSYNEYNVSSSISPTKFVCYAWNKLFRRDFLVKNHLEYEKGLSRIEDAEFMSRVVTYSPIVCFIEKGNYVYVHRPNATLSTGFDDNLINLSIRRLKIDLILLRFFLKFPKTQEDYYLDYLKSNSLIAYINRLYDIPQKQLKRERHYYLNECIGLIPDHLNTETRSPLRRLFDSIIYFSLKHHTLYLIDLIQKFR